MKNPLTPAGIESATFRFVAQHLNHWATAVSPTNKGMDKIKALQMKNVTLFTSNQNCTGYKLKKKNMYKTRHMPPNLAVQNLIVIYSRNDHGSRVGHIQTARQLQCLSVALQTLRNIGYSVPRQNHSLKCHTTIATSVSTTHCPTHPCILCNDIWENIALNGDTNLQ